MASAVSDRNNSADSQRLKQIEENADAYLKGLHKRSGSTSWREIAAQHPELAPELERRLRFVESVFLALQPGPVASAAGDETPTALSTPTDEDSTSPNVNVGNRRDRILSIRCPHCGNLLKIAGQGQAEVTCGSCGSSVSIDPDGTGTQSTVRAPRFISHFRIVSMLGQGAFGTAYKAEDTRLSRYVAIKIPRAGSFATANDELRFVREARHAAQLRHPNIVQVHEIANDQGIPYLVSEFIDGITLADLVSGRKLTYRESAEMIVTIADAIQFAHARHVIHRDLKPSNILLDSNNKPFVCDFGLARHTEGEFTVTLEGEVIGTPAYMSPEQAAGKDVDERTDVYSLGVILYRLVCGELPFRGSQRMMLHQVLHDDPKAPRRLDERVPRDVDTIIMKAMAKERERRYQSAADLAQDVRNWLRSQPISARPVGLVGKTIRWCRRNPSTALATSGAAILLLAIASISTAWGYREQIMRRSEANLKDQAVSSNRQSIQRLGRLHTQYGTERMQAGDSFGALPWFVEALKAATDGNESANSDEIQLQRLRIGMIEQSHPTLSQVWSLGGQIRDLKFSADGKFLLATSRNGAIQILDSDSPEAGILQGPNNPQIRCCDLDPTGARACSADQDHMARLWDVATKSHIAFLAHEDRLRSVSFSSDGQRVATTANDHLAAVWNANDGALIAKLKHPGAFIETARFSPDSQLLLTISRIDGNQPCELRLWNIATGELRVPVMTHPTFIFDAIFDKAAERIFAAGEDGAVVIWNALTGEQIGEPMRHSEKIHRLFLVDDEKTLIASSPAGTVTFWNVNDRTRKKNSIRTMYDINDIAVDFASNFVAVANDDQRVRVFWQYCGRQLGTDIPLGGHALEVAFHPDGRRLAVGGDDGVVRLWDLAGLAPDHNVIRSQGEITTLAFSHDGRRLLIGGRDNTARQWDSHTLSPVGDEMPHGDDVVFCEYDKQGQYVVTAGSDNIAQVWDAATGKRFGPALHHTSQVLRARFIPGTDRLITTTLEGAGAIWKIGAEKPLHQFDQSPRLITLEIHPDGELFALCGEEGTLQIRSTENGSPIENPFKHEGFIYSAEFSPSGKKILTVSLDGSVSLSELNDDAHPSLTWNLGAGVYAATFVGDDETILTGDVTGELRIWKRNGAEFAPVWSSVDASSNIHRAFAHPSLPVVLTAANHTGETFQPGIGFVGMYDRETGDVLPTNISHCRPIFTVALSPDGKQVATGSKDGTVRVWDLISANRPIEDLQKLAAFYSGSSLNEKFQRQPMDAETQRTEFQRLRAKYPEEFATTPDKIQRWNEELTWVRENQN